MTHGALEGSLEGFKETDGMEEEDGSALGNKEGSDVGSTEGTVLKEGSNDG